MGSARHYSPGAIGTQALGALWDSGDEVVAHQHLGPPPPDMSMARRRSRWAHM